MPLPELLHWSSIAENKIFAFVLLFGFFFLIKQLMYKVVLPFVNNPGMRIDKYSTNEHRNKVAIMMLIFFLGVGLFLLLIPSISPFRFIEISASARYCEVTRRISYQDTKKTMTLEDALTIGKESDCILYGKLVTKDALCNKTANQWWITIEETSPKTGCVRSCVIDIFEESAEINYQCGFSESS